MVDGDEGNATGERDRLGLHDADEDAADEARPGGRGDAGEIAHADAGLGQRAGDDAVEMVEMGARRDLRHDAAIGAMLGQLGEHDVGADALAGVAHHRRRGLVAAGLDAEDQHGCKLASVGAAVGLVSSRKCIGWTSEARGSLSESSGEEILPLRPSKSCLR